MFLFKIVFIQSTCVLFRENVVDKVISELKNSSLNESVLEEPETKSDNIVPPGYRYTGISSFYFTAHFLLGIQLASFRFSEFPELSL